MSSEIDLIYREWQEAIRDRFNIKGEQVVVAKPSNPAHLSILKEMCLKAGFTSDQANSILLILEKDDDKYKSIGYGRYKLKTDIGPDGKGKEGTPTFTKDDAGNYVKSGEDDEKKDDEEKKEKSDTNPNFAKDDEEPKPGQSTIDGDHLTSKKPEKEKPKQDRWGRLAATKREVKTKENLSKELDFILENREAVRLKSGGGSNSPSVQDVKDLKEFTEKRIEQDKRRIEAQERGDKFDEEPYVHPSIKQRKVDDESLDRSIDYLKEKLDPKDFEKLMNRFAKGGAVPSHLTKLTKLKKGEPGYPGLDPNSPGYKRAREIIRLYLKNDCKSPVTGKPLPLSHMEPDHRLPFTTAESDLVDSNEFEGLSLKAKKPPDGNSIQEIMKKRKNELSDDEKKIVERLEELQRKYDDPTTNMDLMSGPVNQFKGSLVDEKLLTSIRRKLAENPEEKKLIDEYTSERKRLITKYHRDAVKNGSVPPYHEKQIRDADAVETNAMMKAHNYFHPDAKTVTMYTKGDKTKGIEPDPDYYQKVKDFWAKKGVDLPENIEDVNYNLPPFNQTLAIYVQAGRSRGGAKRRPVKQDHEYMTNEFQSQNYFGNTIEDDKNQEEVIDEARKEINEILDRKRIQILKIQLSDPELSDRKRANRQKELDDLVARYGVA